MRSLVHDEIDRTSVLTEEEERDLTRRAADGDPAARDLLVRANLRLVVSVAARYRSRYLTPDDLVAHGVHGLVQAIDRFDPDRGNRLSTLAVFWIRREVSGAVRDADIVRKPAHVQNRTPLCRVSLQTPLTEDLTLGDTIVCDGEKPDEAAHAALLAKDVRRMLDALPLRERQIIELRFGIRADGAEGHTYTLEEIGRVLRVSRERARQLEKRALARLRRRGFRTSHARRN